MPADLKQPPIEYLQMDRVFFGIDFAAGSRITKATVDLMGDHVLMYQSDSHHRETQFPDNVDTVIGWRKNWASPPWENSCGKTQNGICGWPALRGTISSALLIMDIAGKPENPGTPWDQGNTIVP